MLLLNGNIQLFFLQHTICEIEVDNILIWNTLLLCHVLEIGNCCRVQLNGYLLFLDEMNFKAGLV